MVAIAVIAAVVGLVWGTALLMRGSLVTGCLLFLVLASCCGPYLLSFDVAGVTLSIDRLMLVALAAAYVMQRRHGRADPKPIVREDLLLVALIGTMVVSTFTHDWHAASPTSVPIIQHLINGYLIPLAIYWVARQSVLNRRSVTSILVVLVAFGVYLALTGVFETFGAWVLVFPRYIANPELGLHFGRARGPMIQSICYGLYLGTSLLCLWLLFQRLPRRWWPLLPALAGLFLAALFFTKTRSVWVGAGCGLFLVLMFTLHGRLRTVVLSSMVMAALVVGVAKSDAIMGLKREGTVADTRRSAGMRTCFAYVSWKMFLDRPITGFGFGQFAHEKLPYLTDQHVDLELESIRPYEHHNTFLSTLTETGLIGLGLLLTLLVHWTWLALTLIRSQRAPPWVRSHGVLLLGTLGVVFWQMVGHEISFSPLEYSLLFLIAGVAVGIKASMQREQATAPAVAFSPQPQPAR